MRFDIYKEARLGLLIFSILICLSLVFYFIASLLTSMGYKGAGNTFEVNAEADNKSKITVIIDPGHGGEDPGAVENGLLEKDLNLDIGKSLHEYLLSCGYDSVMTRTEDKLLYNNGEEHKKKYYDLTNRYTLSLKYENAIFVSIHMNKFPAEYCKGLQTFYSNNNCASRIFADSIQNNARILQTDNKRNVKDGTKDIYLLKKISIPAVLVECGFLSNTYDAANLSDEKYKASLVLSIYCGISEFLEVKT